MCLKLILAVTLGVITVRAERIQDDIQSTLLKQPVSSNFSDFFVNWKINTEKMQNIRAEGDGDNSTLAKENRQKRKELETKLEALQELYNLKNWKIGENELLVSHAQDKGRQMTAPLYDSLLTRRTFIPSLKTILIELSLMTLSIVALNAFQSAMAPTKKHQKIKNHGYHRLYTDHEDYTNNLSFN